MNRALPIALLCGVAIGAGTFWFVVSDGLFALCMAALYFGAVYFYVAFDVSVTRAAGRFGQRTDRMAYQLGSVGLAVGAVAILGSLSPVGSWQTAFVVFCCGLVGFFTSVSQAVESVPRTD